MKIYFVVEENISNTRLKGTRYICKGGVRRTYGEFTLKNGFLKHHKAELEMKNARKFYRTCTHLTRVDVWIHYIEDYDI